MITPLNKLLNIIEILGIQLFSLLLRLLSVVKKGKGRMEKAEKEDKN